MRNWSIPVVRVFGTEVRLHLTFLLLLLFVWLTEAASHAGGPGRPLALVGIILGSVVVHELMHALAGLHGEVGPRSIVLLPIGGVTLLDESARREPDDSMREIRIALAGPAVNLVLAAVIAAVGLSLYPQKLAALPLVHSSNLLRSAVWVNVILGVLNLLPAYPLDGGRLLRSWFRSRMDPIRATRQAVMVGQFFSMAFIFLGIWNSWLMLVGFFLFVGAQLEDRSAVFQSVLASVSMDEVMLTDFATLSPADTLEDALHKAVHSLQDDFPVIRGSDLVGVISRGQILANLRASGNGYIQGAMQRVFQVAERGDSLASVFHKITANGATLIPIIDQERLVGIVTLQNLMHSMALLAETRKLKREEME